jgi:hypothetical protein
LLKRGEDNLWKKVVEENRAVLQLSWFRPGESGDQLAEEVLECKKN